MNIKAPDAGLVSDLRRLWQEAFGDTDAFLDGFFDTAWSQSRSRCVILAGEVAAALYWFDCVCRGKKIAYIYAVATGKKHRGKGLCRALMGHTHADLQENGYSGAVLVPAEGLFAMYESMGYRVCGSVREFSCKEAEMPVSLRQVGAEEYARLRIRYLPEGGVVQEGENLTFLSTFAQFYAGKDFCLCGSVQDGIFFGQELLGNTQSAPGILKALGCTQGNFRTPGCEKPFSMCLPFDDTAFPTYFGLAFD